MTDQSESSEEESSQEVEDPKARPRRPKRSKPKEGKRDTSPRKPKVAKPRPAGPGTKRPAAPKAKGRRCKPRAASKAPARGEQEKNPSPKASRSKTRGKRIARERKKIEEGLKKAAKKQALAEKRRAEKRRRKVLAAREKKGRRRVRKERREKKRKRQRARRRRRRNHSSDPSSSSSSSSETDLDESESSSSFSDEESAGSSSASETSKVTTGSSSSLSGTSLSESDDPSVREAYMRVEAQRRRQRAGPTTVVYSSSDLKDVRAPWLKFGDGTARQEFRLKYLSYLQRHDTVMRRRPLGHRVLPQAVVECIEPDLLLYICMHELPREARTNRPEDVDALAVHEWVMKEEAVGLGAENGEGLSKLRTLKCDIGSCQGVREVQQMFIKIRRIRKLYRLKTKQRQIIT